MENNPKIEYSSILKEIIRFRLPLFLRWGSLWIVLLLVLFFGFMSFITFPVTQTGTIVFIPAGETGNCVLPADARVAEILVSEQKRMQKQDVLCSYNTQASVMAVLKLEQWADSVIQRSNRVQLTETVSTDDLGELAEAYLAMRIAVLNAQNQLSQQKQVEKFRLKLTRWKKQHCLIATHSGEWQPFYKKGGKLVGYYLNGKQKYHAILTFQGKRINLIKAPGNVDLHFEGNTIHSRLQDVSIDLNSQTAKGTTEIITLDKPVFVDSNKGYATIDLGKLSLFKQFFN